MGPTSLYARPGPIPGDDVTGGVTGISSEDGELTGCSVGTVMGLSVKRNIGTVSDGDSTDGTVSDSCVGITAVLARASGAGSVLVFHSVTSETAVELSSWNTGLFRGDEAFVKI